MTIDVNPYTASFLGLANLARSIAEDHYEDKQHHIVAILIKGGNPQAYGINKMRHARHHSYFEDSLHAEADLIKKVGTDKIKNGKIFLYRFNLLENSPARHETLNARPCPLCQSVLKEAGASRIVYIERGIVKFLRHSELGALCGSPSQITKHYMGRATEHGKFNPLVYRI